VKIGGFQKVSLIDYPGLISAIVFLQGCNFRCPYCHNSELVIPRLFQPCLSEKEVLEFIRRRQGKLDAVVISGGEPTIQDDLIDFIRKIKKIGYAVKLDTNGSNPQIIKSLLEEELIDYIAMDVKGPGKKYKNITGVTVDENKIRQSIKVIIQSGIAYEFRTTIVKGKLTENDILETGMMIAGARRYVLQKFVPVKTIDKKFLKEGNYSDDELERIKKHLEKEIPSVIVR
jgi:pyruvate formate lyase activating enzyme